MPPKKPGKCHICGGTEFWLRPASQLGGPAEYVCSKCHPDPNARDAAISSLQLQGKNSYEEDLRKLMAGDVVTKPPL